MAHVGLVHHDPCKCKIKSFRAVSSIERSVSKEALARDATIIKRFLLKACHVFMIGIFICSLRLHLSPILPHHYVPRPSLYN